MEESPGDVLIQKLKEGTLLRKRDSKALERSRKCRDVSKHFENGIYW